MKANYALSLSFEGIGLLLRSGNLWDRVGDVPLDVEDLPAAISLLRRTATEISDAPLNAKLLLPTEQIKYIRMADPGGSPEVQAEAVRHALDGATPYTLEELAYDWAGENGEITIAAVARETLEEAEGFATSNGFTPLYFTALPAPGQFAGEPFFGETQAFQAAGLGPLERDTAPVEIGGVATPPPPQPEPEPAAEPEPQPEAIDEVEEAEEAPRPVPGFSSRRSEPPAAAPTLSGVTRSAPNTAAGTIDIPESDAPAPPAFSSRREPPAPAKPQAQPERAAPPPRAPRSVPPPPPLPAPPPNIVPPTQSEKQRLTIFGARSPEQDAKPAAVRGTRFMGLILTAILLLFLIGVGAWAAIFTEEGISGLFRRSEPTAIALAPDAPDELAIEGEEAMVLTPPDEQEALASEPDTPLNPLAPAQMSLADARQKYAVTGIWARSPNTPDEPAPDSLSDFYIPSIDPAIASKDAVALPALAGLPGTDRPSNQSNPATRGQRFTFDIRGLVAATPQGALTPDGHRVFAGRPPSVPASYPDRSTAAPQETLKVARLRPRGRPEGLVEANERAELGGRSRAELAALRPKARPASIAARIAEEERLAAARLKAEEDAKAAEAARQKAEEDAAKTAAAVAAAIPKQPGPDLDPNATAQAVKRSVKPKQRPNNMSRIVKRAQKQEERVTKVAAVAPKTVQPRVPSRASVAKSATERNVLNLRRVNLIGVYGKPSNRRALVRLSNGRFRKVKVGDRIDGGRVSAIGDAELLYKKNGRNVRLKMPRG